MARAKPTCSASAVEADDRAGSRRSSATISARGAPEPPVGLARLMNGAPRPRRAAPGRRRARSRPAQPALHRSALQERSPRRSSASSTSLGADRQRRQQPQRVRPGRVEHQPLLAAAPGARHRAPDTSSSQASISPRPRTSTHVRRALQAARATSRPELHDPRQQRRVGGQLERLQGGAARPPGRRRRSSRGRRARTRRRAARR